MDRKWRQFSGEIKPERRAGQRRLRVGEELRHALSGILRRGDCRDPALRDASVAVTEVRLGADLRNATVFVMPLGGASAAEIVAGLKRSSAFLKRLVAREVALAALLAQPEVERDLRGSATRTKNGDDAG
jgi:ribosome-binding factor A